MSLIKSKTGEDSSTLRQENPLQISYWTCGHRSANRDGRPSVFYAWFVCA